MQKSTEQGAAEMIITPTLVAAKVKLSHEQVREIVARRLAGEDREEIAADYNVTAVYVGQLGRTRQLAAFRTTDDVVSTEAAGAALAQAETIAA